MKNTILLLTLTIFSTFTYAQNKTPDYWKCTNRSGGSWTFGRAPSACDVDSFIKPEYVSSEYGPVIFNDSLGIDQERVRYMSELYPVIREISEYFLKNRKPDVDDEEIFEFSKAAFAIGYQESYWSHYRIPEGKSVQMMRGDYGHGHGIFQVDDRWHYAAINKTVGANLVLNIIYSLEEYYTAWKRAPAQSCVKNERDWVARARSAYSAYNGGASKICRWTNSGDKWAKNDQGFKTKYDGLGWEKYVEDTSKEGYLNIECAYNEGVNCQKGEVHRTPKEGVLYSHTDRGYCVFDKDKEKFFCTQKNEVCLISKVYTKTFSSVSNARLEDDFDDIEFEELEANQVCSNITSLIPVLSSIELKKNINVRATAGGDLMGVLKAGQTTQVLASVVTDAIKQDRYYKIVFGQKIGFVFAGNKSDANSWALKTDKILANKIFAQTGDYVMANDNFNSIDGDVTINDGDKFKVLNVLAKEEKLVLTLEINSGEYDFFAGDMNIDNYAEYFSVTGKEDTTVPTEPTPTPAPPSDNNEIRVGRLSKNLWWKGIKTCAATSCSSAGNIKGPKLSSKTFEILEEKNGWYKIRQSGKTGWIESQYVKVL